MKVATLYQGKKAIVEVKDHATILNVLEQLQINPEIVLVSRNGTITPETERVRAGDTLDIIRTISGG